MTFVASDRQIDVFKNAELLSLDIETKDPLLVDQGPGTHRGDGHICGVSMAALNGPDIVKHYFSFSHYDTPQEQTQRNKKIVKDICAKNNAKIGANISYDIEWLEHTGTPVNGPKNDVQYAEPLLDEYKRSYSLSSLAKTYRLKDKQTNILEDYANVMGWKGKAIKHIWRMPEKVARAYALVDAELPLQIFAKQKIALEQQGLFDLYRLECDLIPVLQLMRKNGVRIDVPYLKKVSMEAAQVQFDLKEKLYKWAGRSLNPNSSTQLAEVFDHYGIPYPRHPLTSKMRDRGIKQGNPKIDKMTLTRLSSKYPECKTILDYKHYTTLINLFLSKYANFICNDRLYCSFHPLRTDDYGTVSGRFSSSKPNLQQVSAKEEDQDDAQLGSLQGKIVRRLFIPEDGHKWAKNDYSQIEYRVLMHYATGTGSVKQVIDKVKAAYNKDPKTDFHQIIVDMTGFSRRDAKRVNFGGLYGIGVATASKLFGWSIDDAETFLAAYHKAAPYIRTTRRRVLDVAAQRGYIMTLLKRRARVHISRKLHSLFNRLIQGSAADIMKKGMLDAYNKGLFEELVLHLTVHDELDTSFRDNKAGNEALRELTHTLENTVKLDVPILVDCHTGDNWAEAD